MRRREADEAWARFGEHSPVAHGLRVGLPLRWVRIYSLPDGQRYPASPADYEEILRRADHLVGSVCDAGEDLMLVTARYGPRGEPPPISQAHVSVHVDPVYWRQVEESPDPVVMADDDDLPLHLWASWHTYSPRSLDPLIRKVADWDLIGVLLVAPEPGVVLHPYDGGFDMILPTAEQRDAFRNRHLAWVSPRPDGL